MRFEKQPIKLPIANIVTLVQREQKKVKRHPVKLNPTLYLSVDEIACEKQDNVRAFYILIIDEKVHISFM